MSAGAYTGYRRPTTAEGKAWARDEARRKTAELVERLDAAVQDLASSDEAWAEYLRCSGAMHSYSWGNRLLILVDSVQRGRPVPAMVAGFHTWKRLGRPVRSAKELGYKPGIAIRVPLTVKRETESDSGETETSVRTFFKVGHVYAVEDTDGPPMSRPSPVAIDDDGDDARAIYDRLEAAAAALGVPVVQVVEVEGEPGARGQYVLADGRVEIVAGHPAAMRAKTLAHELAHALEHRAGALDDRVDGEMIAESVAFVVMGQYGVDTSTYSAPYVAAWGEDPKRFRVVLERVAKVSSAILAVADHAGTCAACGWDGESDGGGCERCR